ncbi:peptide chain release factor-like protein [Gemmobacter sp. 24YEA27]|uniref:peptide chain release factor-like protein n=1 Tax=Gemmobacter sp. 24YEA27 TaxID=3040672 RepID=UPI0024B3309D|nr:peptide chain release factor-like protein [Gemmobacter sp. 24YEA27]
MTERETLLLSSGNGPGECRQAVAHLLVRLAEEAELLGLDMDVAERPALHGPASAVIVLTGTGAAEMVREWEGSILWRCASSLRPKHPRKNWFAQIFRLAPVPVAIRIDAETVEMQAIRAGGPGGQHQNKTSSAIRARWVDPEGRAWSVVVRDSRSQHMNRRVALDRLSVLISADRAQALATQKAAVHDMHGQIQRGDPCKVFEGEEFRGVR